MHACQHPGHTFGACDKNLSIDHCHALKLRPSYCFAAQHCKQDELYRNVSTWYSFCICQQKWVWNYRSMRLFTVYHKSVCLLLKYVSCFSLQKEFALEKTPVSGKQPDSLDFSLESLNKLNHSSGSLYPDMGLSRCRGDCHPSAETSMEDCCKVDEPSSSSFSSKPGADPVGSLSDSLYDSFSSCTSHISNDM